MSSNLSKLEKTGITFAIAASVVSILGFEISDLLIRHRNPSGVWKAESLGGKAYQECLYIEKVAKNFYFGWMLDEPQPNRNAPVFITVNRNTASFQFTTKQGWGKRRTLV